MDLLKNFVAQLIKKIKDNNCNYIYIVYHRILKKEDRDKYNGEFIGVFDNPEETIDTLFNYTRLGKPQISDAVYNYYQRPQNQWFDIVNGEFSIRIENSNKILIRKNTINNYTLIVYITREAKEISKFLNIHQPES